MISSPCFSTRKCHLNPRSDADLSLDPPLSKLTQICSPAVQPLIPLILIHSSICSLFEGYPFCLTFFKVILLTLLPQNAKSTRIFISE